ncbi:hypothetical protein D3C76_1789890 [compost metagenome]
MDVGRIDPDRADVIIRIENQFKSFAQKPGSQLHQAFSNGGCEVNGGRGFGCCFRFETRHGQQLVDQPAGTIDAGDQVFK